MACCLLAGFATQVFLIYHADAMEVARHMLLIPIGTLVVLVFAGFIVLDGGIDSERPDVDADIRRGPICWRRPWGSPRG
jgi:hypothetical protein